MKNPLTDPDDVSVTSASELHERGKFDAAINQYQIILRNVPQEHKVCHLIGHAYIGRGFKGDIQHAIEYLQKAITIDDSIPAYHNDLGTAFWNLRDIDRAYKAFLDALALGDPSIETYFNLGNCLWAMGDLEAANKYFKSAADMSPAWLQAHYMHANCLYGLGRPDMALKAYERALKHPRWGFEATLGKSQSLLKLGKWRDAWPLFEGRLSSLQLAPYKMSTREEWTGEIEKNCTLLVYGEQGIGDLIMMLRYLRDVRYRVGRVIVACDTSLHQLLRHLSFIDQLVDKPSSPTNIDIFSFDKRVATLSLPLIFNTTTDRVPSETPYLTCDQIKKRSWKARLPKDSLNVGLVWAGNPQQKDDRFRSCPPSEYSALSIIDNTRFFSLQTGEARKNINQIEIPGLSDMSLELNDFEDTACLIEALDLVITVDTAPAHLAGALGKPVWTLLWTGHCWRYLTHRSDTPWYPTMRLFRQSNVGNWTELMVRVCKELQIIADKKQKEISI